jgi:acetylornithine deacetylase
MDLVPLLKALVAVDSTSARSNLPVLDLLEREARAAGFETRRLCWTDADGVPKGDLICRRGPDAPGGLALVGHTDCVPFDVEWKEALRGEVRDGLLFGRGAADTKGFLAAALVAAGRAREHRAPLTLLFTADEEVGCLGAARLAPELAALLGDVPLPAECWIGEPTSWEVYHAHKSYAVFDVRVRGRGGHSGLPDAGTSAIGAAAAVLAEIGRYQEELRARPAAAFAAVFPEAPYTTVNLGTIHGGSAPNMIADECTLRVSTRALPDVDPLEPYREIARRLRAIEARDPASPRTKAEVVIGEPMSVPALHAPRGTALEHALLERLGPRTVRGALLGADGCRFQSIGVGSLICGPGDFGEAHQPNESLSRRAFEEGADVIRSVVERLCCAE